MCYYAVWSKSRTTDGPGGFTRYATKTCLNHLKVCPNQPYNVRQWAEMGSPKKSVRYSPYETTQLGATSVPGTFLSSFQMLPPPGPPSTRFNSPALHVMFSPFHALFTTKLTFTRHFWHMTYYSSQLEHTLFTRNTRQPVSNPLLQQPRPGQLPLSPP